MLTLMIAFAVACGGFCTAYLAVGLGLGWSVFFGLLGFGAVQGVFHFVIQKRVKRDMAQIQQILVNGQKQLQMKVQRWQMRPPSSITEAQRQVAADTKAFVAEAIAKTAILDRYRPWVPMMDRQIATAKLQLSWMVKDFKTVDALLPMALFLDPMMAAIKMARLYMTGADLAEIAKVYRKGVSRTRYNGNVLLAATMSWMQVQRGDADGAFKTLTEALKKSDNETLKRNHECLMNNRIAHFNNSGIGDPWYSLLLEEQKYKVPRQRSVYR